MAYLVQFQINVFGLMILLVLFLFVSRSKIKTFAKDLIIKLIFATSIAIIMEPLTWIFDGMQFNGAYFLEHSTNFILFLMGPIIGGLLLSYVDFRIYQNPKRILKKIYYQQATIFTLLVLIMNIFYPLYYIINPLTNSFRSGPFKEFHYVVLASLYVAMLIMIVKNRKNINLVHKVIFVLCFAIPIVGMVVQMFDSRLHFSWTSIVLGILVAYVFLETNPSEEDYLTKSYNRASFEALVNNLEQNQQEFALVIFDLNDFKEINDQHGHHVGDTVLMEFTKILKKQFIKDGYVARLGGDEFAVIIQRNFSNIHKNVQSISKHIINHESQYVSHLTFSYGYQRHDKNMGIDELYNKADQKMYANKEKIKTILNV